MQKINRLEVWEKIIKNSGLFDEEFYLSTYQDVKNAGVDPVMHYIKHGAKEGRNPSKDFNTNSYLSTNNLFKKSGTNPLVHFIIFGERCNSDYQSGVIKCKSNKPIEIDNKTVVKNKAIKRFYEDFNFEKEINIKKRLLVNYENDKEKIDNVKVSIIMPTFNREQTIKKAIDSIIDQSFNNWELIIVDDGSTDDTKKILNSYKDDHRISVIPGKHEGVSRARNTGLRKTTGEYIFYLDSDNEWKKDYILLMLICLIEDNLDCAYSGVEVIDDNKNIIGYRGNEFDWSSCLEANYIDLNVFGHKRSLILECGLFDEKLRRMVDWDLILRYTKYRNVKYVPFIGCIYSDDRSNINRISNSEPYLYRDIVQLKNKESIEDYSQISEKLSLRISIKIPAPFKKRNEWGDYHYALAMKDSLESIGHKVRIDFLEDWYKHDHNIDRVVIVLRGLSKYRPVKGQINIMWNISHPDKVLFDEYEEYDIVYSASHSYCGFLNYILSSNVIVKPLLQATEVKQVEKILFIGNSRKAYRPLVHWAIELGYEVEVYGNHWEGLVDKAYIKDTYISNDKIKSLYATYKIVLNDHWESMKDFGIVSNRIFDVLSVGGNLVSDYVYSAKYIFGDDITMVKSKEELECYLNKISNADYTSRNKNSITDNIKKYHSFDNRMKEIVSDVYNFVKLPSINFNVSPHVEKCEKLRVALITMGGKTKPQSSNFIRLVTPLTCDFMIDKIELVEWENEFKPQSLHNIDICIVQRTVIYEENTALELIRFLRKNKIRLIIDSDDAFGKIDKNHHEYDLLQKKDKVLRLLMKNADGIWFSTDNLAADYKDINVDKFIIPNGLDPRLWVSKYTNTNERFRDKKIKFVYMGTATHDYDFYEVIYPALQELNKKYSDRFSLTIIGAVRHAPRDNWIDIVHVPLGEHKYPNFVRWFVQFCNNNDFDVGLAPLFNSDFNNCKTDIKLLDYIGAGILPVVSNIEAYNKIEEINNIAITSNNDSWYATLENIITERDKNTFNEIISNGKKYLWDKRDVNGIARKQFSSIEHIMSK